MGLFNQDINDVDLFPALALPQPRAETSRTVTPASSEGENGLISSEEQDGWVVVAPEATEAEPRHAQLVSMAAPRRATRRGSSRRRARHILADDASLQQNEMKMDWSLAGIPRDMVKRLLHGNRNAAHLSIHAKKHVPSPVPLSALRSQSEDARKRTRNASARARSVSKVRSTQQASQRR